MRQRVWRGAAAGTSAWLVYGVIELILSIEMPRLWGFDRQLHPWQWPLLGAILVFYSLCGFLSGGFCGVLLHLTGKTFDKRGFHALGSLTLAAVFLANLTMVSGRRTPEILALVLAAGVCALLAATVISSEGLRRCGFLTNPWMVALLLLCTPWLSAATPLQKSSTFLKSAVSAAAFTGLVLLAGATERFGLGTTLRRFQKPIVAVAVAVCILMVAPTQTHKLNAGLSIVPAADKPNVLLITMDTVRADHVSLYGHQRNTTPHLSDFAREATVYNRALASSSFTLPTHASMFTGFYPSWHGATISMPRFPHGRPLPPPALTLAEILQKNGYWTAGVIANRPYLQANTGLSQGFQVWDVQMPVRLTGFSAFYLREKAAAALRMILDTGSFDAYYSRASDINQRAIALLEDARNRGPFFLFLNYMDAHTPYVPPGPFRDEFPGRDHAFHSMSHVQLTDEINAEKVHLTETVRRHLLSQYDGGIAYIDSAIGELLGKMRELGLYENTLIMITSDHGEAFGERNLMQHGVGSVYQDQIHVPLLVKYPGQHQGGRSDAVVSQVDLMPTVLDVAGYEPPVRLQGQSLRSARAASDAIFAEARAFGEQQTSVPRLQGWRRALIAGPWKLVVWSRGVSELYDLDNDPNELKNLYRRDDPRSAQFTARMNAWVGSIPPQQQAPSKLDKTTEAQIESLGYVAH
jgi:arylsulfatase A-like enzyme